MTRPPLSKDTTMCISLAGHPSNIGTRFHNHLYDVLGLDFVYKAFTTTDIAAAIGGVRALGIRGCSVSMPFKEAVLALVDDVEPSAQAIESVNTIVNDTSVPGGWLTASNTDYLAVQQLIAQSGLDPADPVVIRGSGGMAKAVGAAFVGAGFGTGSVVARNPDSGCLLADRLGYTYVPEVPDIAGPILVNVTPIGMAGAPQEHHLAFGQPAIAEAAAVLDVVALPSETPLIRAARAAGTPVLTGAQVIALQAAEQFERYTGVRPSSEQIAEAAELSRA